MHNEFRGTNMGSVVQVGVVNGNLSISTAAPLLPIPWQLPLASRYFVGRASELGRLSEVLRNRDGRASTLVTIDGVAGIGKTAMVTHWAHQVANSFPDGVLFADLRGFDPAGRATDPAVVLNDFLDALGVRTEGVAPEVSARAALYRSALAEKRILVILDNARNSDQVRPLLPSGPRCSTVVTSRNRLTGLAVRDGAIRLTLNLLAHSDAVELLAARIGHDTVLGEPNAVANLVRLCTSLPLALSIVAARIAVSGEPTVATVAGQLEDMRDRLDGLGLGETDLDLRAVFSWSKHTLTAPAARLFGLLGLHPASDISTNAASALSAMPGDEVYSLLEELADAHLVEPHSLGRYQFHDLLRVYAMECADNDEPDTVRRAALDRTFSYYLGVSMAADRVLDPHRTQVREPVCIDGQEQLVTDPEQAMQWFVSEKNCLLAAIDHSARQGGFEDYTWQLAWALTTFFYRRGYWHHYESVQRTALAAAQQLSDRSAQALTLHMLGDACSWQRRYADAETYLKQAFDIALELADYASCARISHTLSWAYAGQRDYVQAVVTSKQALNFFRASGNQSGVAHSLNALARFHSMLDEHSVALTCTQEALSIFRTLEHAAGESSTLESLGMIHERKNDQTRALDFYEQALCIYRGSDQFFKAARMMHKIGDIQQARGDLVTATSSWAAALDIFVDAGHADAELVRGKLQAAGVTTVTDMAPGTEPKAN